MDSPWVGVPALVLGVVVMARWVALRLGRTPGTRRWANEGVQGRRFAMLVLPTLGSLLLLVAALPRTGSSTIATSGGEQALRLLASVVVVLALVLFLGHGLLGVTLRPVPRWLLPRWVRSGPAGPAHPRPRRSPQEEP